MSPKDRFSKRSHKRYKRLRKIVREIKHPKGHIIITGRTYGLGDAVYVEVHGVGRSYIDAKPTREWVKSEIKELLS